MEAFEPSLPNEELFLRAMEMCELITQITMLDEQGKERPHGLMKSDVCFSKDGEDDFAAFIIESKWSGRCILVGIWQQKINIIAKASTESFENLWVLTVQSSNELRSRANELQEFFA